MGVNATVNEPGDFLTNSSGDLLLFATCPGLETPDSVVPFVLLGSEVGWVATEDDSNSVLLRRVEFRPEWTWRSSTWNVDQFETGAFLESEGRLHMRLHSWGWIDLRRNLVVPEVNNPRSVRYVSLRVVKEEGAV